MEQSNGTYFVANQVYAVFFPGALPPYNQYIGMVAIFAGAELWRILQPAGRQHGVAIFTPKGEFRERFQSTNHQGHMTQVAGGAEASRALQSVDCRRGMAKVTEEAELRK